MEKSFIKLNVDDNYLSIGNFCRILKDNSVNKSAALQSEIFCLLFETESVNYTTINNYCIGCRKISDSYKQIYINKKKHYNKDKYLFVNIVTNIINILDGRVYVFDNEKFAYDSINSNTNLKNFCTKLYNISKNDKEISNSFSSNLYSLINGNKLYECLIEILFYIILEFKQPIYVEDIKKNSIEKLLMNTNISSNELLEYLNLKYIEGANYNYLLKKMANEENAYACFELGNDEYLGHIKGYPRYNISYNYLKIASDKGHPTATYLMAKMYFNKNIGTGSNEDLELSFNLYNKAMGLGSIASINSIGLFYLNGIYPVKKNIDKAIDYFNKAISYDYAYAYNNLGKIYEIKKEYNKAIDYYIKSADLGESWACNKVGEYYRLNNNMDKAFEYYNKGLESPVNYLCYYNCYNLGKYFYYNGNPDIDLEKDINKAIELINEASSNGIIEASIFLLYYYVDLYLKTKDKDIIRNIDKYKSLIEINSRYTNTIKKEIEGKLKEIKNREIDINYIYN